MQDLLDYTGPIVINVRIQDIDQARHDLELFAKEHGSFSNLILKLDMNESEIEAFSRSSANQEKILQELLNSSVSLNQLKSLEIQYRDQDNPTMLTSIRLQGDALRKKIRLLSEQYHQESEKIVAISKKVGLDTISQEKSVQEFDAYANEVDPIQNPQAIDIPIRRTSQLSLLLNPDTGSYGDTIQCFGYYFSLYGYRVSSIPGKQVTLYLDDRSMGTVTTDDIGSYTVDIAVDKNRFRHSRTSRRVRSHAVGPAHPHDRSRGYGHHPCRQPVAESRRNTLYGYRECEPDRSGTLLSSWSGTGPMSARPRPTQRGSILQSLSLPNGNHTVQARFTGAGYPLNPSESDIQTIVVSIPRIPFIPQVDYSFFIFVGVFSIFFLFLGGAMYYLRRTPALAGLREKWAARTGSSEESAAEAPAEPGEGTGTALIPEAPSPDETPAGIVTLFQRYAVLLQSSGLGEASHLVYADLSARVARDLKISRYRVLTPREMSRSCRDRPYCGAFSRLIAAYERIRYGGYHADPVREEFEATMQSTDAHLGGEDH